MSDSGWTTEGQRESWPADVRPSGHALPRVEDMPIVEQGYDPERVQEAFDAFYRHAAQLDASLRVLEAVDAFRRHATDLRADIRALRAASWTPQPVQQQRWHDPYSAARGGRPVTPPLPSPLPRLALEAAFIILVAVGAGLAELSTPMTIAVVGAAWLIVGLVELVVAQTRSSALPAARPYPTPVLEPLDDEAVAAPSPDRPGRVEEATVIGAPPAVEAAEREEDLERPAAEAAPELEEVGEPSAYQEPAAEEPLPAAEPEPEEEPEPLSDVAAPVLAAEQEPEEEQVAAFATVDGAAEADVAGVPPDEPAAEEELAPVAEAEQEQLVEEEPVPALVEAERWLGAEPPRLPTEDAEAGAELAPLDEELVPGLAEAEASAGAEPVELPVAEELTTTAAAAREEDGLEADAVPASGEAELAEEQPSDEEEPVASSRDEVDEEPVPPPDDAELERADEPAAVAEDVADVAAAPAPVPPRRRSFWRRRRPFELPPLEQGAEEAGARILGSGGETEERRDPWESEPTAAAEPAMAAADFAEPEPVPAAEPEADAADLPAPDSLLDAAEASRPRGGLFSREGFVADDVAEPVPAAAGAGGEDGGPELQPVAEPDTASEQRQPEEAEAEGVAAALSEEPAAAEPVPEQPQPEEAEAEAEGLAAALSEEPAAAEPARAARRWSWLRRRAPEDRVLEPAAEVTFPGDRPVEPAEWGAPELAREQEAEPGAEPELAVEPEPRSAAEPADEPAAPEPDAEHAVEPELAVELWPEDEVEVADEPAEASEPEADPAAKPEFAGALWPEARAEVADEPAEAPESDAEHAVEPEFAVESSPDGEAEVADEPEAGTEPEAQSAVEPAPPIDADAGYEAEDEPAVEPEPAPVAEAEPEPPAEAEAEPETDLAAETSAERGAGPVAVPTADAEWEGAGASPAPDSPAGPGSESAPRRPFWRRRRHRDAVRQERPVAPLGRPAHPEQFATPWEVERDARIDPWEQPPLGAVPELAVSALEPEAAPEPEAAAEPEPTAEPEPEPAEEPGVGDRTAPVPVGAGPRRRRRGRR